MIIDIAEEKLVVISDLHIGNPIYCCKRLLTSFIQQAMDEGFSVCLNGDGLDVVQSSFQKMAGEIPEVFGQFRQLRDRGLRGYYVIGNHDIILEHLLADWDFLILTPFLNLTSGGYRIRIEHSHLYDPAFAGHPHLYHLLTKMAGWVLDNWPGAFALWTEFERRRFKPGAGEPRLRGEPAAISQAAREILRRGFDWVIFGHTHHAGVVSMPESGHYLNTGSWLVRPTFARIVSGKVDLCEFQQIGAGKYCTITDAPVITGG